jgi:hypothetical protein
MKRPVKIIAEKRAFSVEGCLRGTAGCGTIPRLGAIKMRTLGLMVLGVTLAGCEIVAAGSAQASPITLICNGSMTLYGHGTTPIENETAILDYDKRVFKPPFYPSFPITRVDESTVVFSSETGELSTLGNLDRVSGNLTMNAMRPSERQRLQRGETVHFLAYISAKCTPAQKMF